MANNYIDLTGDLGTTASTGSAVFTASNWLTDATDLLILPPEPVTANLRAAGTFSALLLATDNPAPLPAGWTWSASIQLPGINANTFSFLLPAGPVAFTAIHASPAVFTWTASTALTSVASGTGVQLSGGSLPGGFTAGITYYVVNAASDTFQLSATQGGAALGSTSAGSGNVTVVSVDISTIAPVESAAAMAAYLPLTGGTLSGPLTLNGSPPLAVPYGAASGYVWTAQGTTGTGAWAPSSGGGGGSVTSVTAGDASMSATASGGAVTLETGTLDQIANLHPAAANWSNNSRKITSLANGGAAQDAAALGQTVSGILTTLGDIPYENSAPAPARLPGNTASTKNFLTSTGSGGVAQAPAWGTIASSDLPAATGSAQGAIVLTADLGNTASSPEVVSTHLSAALPVSQGGTGDQSLTAWELLAGGTASTTAVQQIALGSSGQVLTSNGAGTLPSMQALPASVGTVTAGDASIVISGTGTAPTIETGTLDQIANLHAPAANWSNNSKKITSLANGLAAQDAAAYGQTPAGGATVTVPEGGTGDTSLTAYGVLTGGTASTSAVQQVAGTASTVLPLVSGGTAALPTWQVLPVGGGGLGTASLGICQILAGGTAVASAVQQVGPGTAGQVLTSNGTGTLPTMQALPAFVSSLTAADSSITVSGSGTAPTVSSVPALIAQRMFAA